MQCKVFEPVGSLRNDLVRGFIPKVGIPFEIHSYVEDCRPDSNTEEDEITQQVQQDHAMDSRGATERGDYDKTVKDKEQLSWKTVGQTATLKKTRSHNESSKTTLWILEERRSAVTTTRR
ncbi:hypothetical protein DFH08DRAFT_818775 [Mycena albidolilacea]|uniref:Uncharacterized protein n=1 Tax=Mycena albidolilacea TaxID=1033008 RepID=A0AAD6ZGN6_9AGAR|nr:hypothetical protein DFH08DRAFT_818775 [Mycena albidolilacea]